MGISISHWKTHLIASPAKLESPRHFHRVPSSLSSIHQSLLPTPSALVFPCCLIHLFCLRKSRPPLRCLPGDIREKWLGFCIVHSKKSNNESECVLMSTKTKNTYWEIWIYKQHACSDEPPINIWSSGRSHHRFYTCIGSARGSARTYHRRGYHPTAEWKWKLGKEPVCRLPAFTETRLVSPGLEQLHEECRCSQSGDNWNKEQEVRPSGPVLSSTPSFTGAHHYTTAVFKADMNSKVSLQLLAVCFFYL